MPKTTLSFYLHIIAIAVIIFAIGRATLPLPPAGEGRGEGGATQKESSFAKASEDRSVYDRVMRTKTIRCGYGLWPKWFEKDPNTGAMSGIFYDYVEALGKSIDLKVEWVEEVAWAAYAEALNSDRIDAMCVGVWENSTRARVSDFTIPIFYKSVKAFVRSGDSRFDNNLSTINNSSVKISVIDGEMGSIIAKKDFALASLVSLPQLADASQMLLNVTSGKADVTFADPETIQEFSTKNPNLLQEVKLNSPLRIFGTTLSIKQDQYKLKRLIDSATQELLQNGEIDQILSKYERYPGSFYRVAKPYQLSTSQ